MKIASQSAVKSRRTISSEPMILFRVAHQTFAIAAEAVQEIRSTDGLAGAAMEFEQLAVPKVRHTIERAHRTYYVVNAGAHFGLPVTRPMLVLILRQLRSAVLVDRIERMAHISAILPLPQAFTGQERKWYLGLAYIDDHVIPVIQPNGFLTPDEFKQLDCAARSRAADQQLERVVQT
jgi:chemotaxis signal transduction protein